MKSRFLNKGRSILFKASGYRYDSFGEYVGYNEETNQIYLKHDGKYFFGNLTSRGKIKCKRVIYYLDHKIVQKDLKGLELEYFIDEIIGLYGYGESEISMRNYTKYLFNKLDKKIILAINKGFLLL